MERSIRLETSSIMPLLEITPRTLPLQQHIRRTLEKDDVKFYTDLYSVEEAIQQIETSFNNAIRSIEKAKIASSMQNVKDLQTLSIIFIKSLSENWYGREETLRWSDVLISEEIKAIQDHKKFHATLSRQLENKRKKYLSMLTISNRHIYVDCRQIQSYWVTPSFVKEVNIKIKVISNALSIEEFFKKIQSAINTAYMETLKVNDVVDIYHLHSLFTDGNIREVWSCNQQFVKKHEKYLKTVPEFERLFDKKVVTIKRIKE